MIVLDTHAWIWWVDNSPRLSQSVRDRIDTDADIRVCGISILEVATAASMGRLVLRPSTIQWLAVAQTAVHIEPLTDVLCCASVVLPGDFHRDPADRLIVALARQLDVELVTADHKILAYKAVKTISVD